MINPAQIIKRWWHFCQSSLGVLDVEPPEPLDDSENQPLPAALTNEISDTVLSLLPPSVHVDAALDTLKDAIQRWAEYDTLPNMMVVLTEPVHSTDGLMTAVLENLEDPSSGFPLLRTYRLDEWGERPADYRNIDASVRDAIAAIFRANRTGTPDHPVPQDPSNPSSEEPTRPIQVIVIPALERYFLRCVDGLEAIETVRQTVVDHPDYFWLIGCNRWAWSYLDKVCYLSAYLDFCWSLPPLDAVALKQWLMPLEDMVELASPPEEEADESESDSAQPPTWRSSDERKYFKDLEKESGGIASVGAALWEYSLCYERMELESDDPLDAAEQQDRLGHINRGAVKVPDSPSLTSDDRYLLYAILLHGTLSSRHLAASLADPQGIVRAQLQSLARKDLIVRNRDCWSINPAYYPSLSRDLRRNNFLVD